MASQNKIIEMIGAIKTIYPYYAKDTNVELLVNTWTDLLKGYDDNITTAAFRKCLQTCKVPPTPADVIEQINALMKTQDQSDEELWSVYTKALRATSEQMSRFGYTFIDSTGISQGAQARQKVKSIWEGLPEKIKGYLASEGELMRNAREWNNDESFTTWEKQRFMKAMPVMEKRQEYNSLMLEGGSRLMIEGAGR